MLYLGFARGPDETLTISGLSTELLETSDVAAFSQLIYFSFVTMSTLGYGDLLPLTPARQNHGVDPVGCRPVLYRGDRRVAGQRDPAPQGGQATRKEEEQI